MSNDNWGGTELIYKRITIIIVYISLQKVRSKLSCSSHYMTVWPCRIAPHLYHMHSQMVPQCQRLAGLQLAVLGLVGLFPVELGCRRVDRHEGLWMLPDRAVTTELGGGGEWQGMKQSGGGTEQSFGSSSAKRGIFILVSSWREKRL